MIADLSEHIKRLQAIYAQIPVFKCIRKCTDCCGPIFMSGLERFLIRKPGKHTGMVSCPWRENGGCGIYPFRPLVCRLFGAVDHPGLTCTFGRSPVFLLGNDQAMSWFDDIQRISIDAGFPDTFHSHGSTNKYLLSPTKIAMRLPKYDFRE